MTSNRPEFVVAINGISKIGAAAVLLSPAWKAVEARHALELTGPVHAVADGAGHRTAWWTAGRRPDHRPRRPGGGRRHPRGPPDRGDRRRHRRGPTRRCWSSARGPPGCPRRSGTPTGRWVAPPHHWCTTLGLGPDDRFQVATPPSHILGLLNLLAAASAGATVRLHRRFDLDEVLRRIESERMTLEMAVAPIALAMANHPDLERFDLSSLRYIMWGATPVSEHVARAVTERIGRALAPGLRGQRGAGHRRQPGRRPGVLAARLGRAAARGRRAAGGRPRHRCRPGPGGDRRDPGPEPIGHGRLPPRGGDRRRLRRRVVPDG